MVRVERKDRRRGEAGTVQTMSSTVPWLYEIFETEAAEVFVSRCVVTLDYVVAMVELWSLSSRLRSCARSCHDAGITHTSERAFPPYNMALRHSGDNKASHFFLPKHSLELRKSVARPNVV